MNAVDEFDNGLVKQVAGYLHHPSRQLDTLTTWEWKDEWIEQLRPFLDDKVLSKLEAEESPFEKQIFLKHALEASTPTLSNDRLQCLYTWIATVWGEINRQKPLPSLRPGPSLAGEVAKLKFEGIASWSKVLSFLDTKLYVIYDSRALHALNWYLLKSGAKKFFPVPAGRGKAVTEFDIETLVRLKGHQVISKVDSAYMRYTSLIRRIHEVLCEGKKSAFFSEASRDKPYFTEMLLFALAKENVNKDIRATVVITVN